WNGGLEHDGRLLELDLPVAGARDDVGRGAPSAGELKRHRNALQPTRRAVQLDERCARELARLHPQQVQRVTADGGHARGGQLHCDGPSPSTTDGLTWMPHG